MKSFLKRWWQVPRALRIISVIVIFAVIGSVDNYESHRHHSANGQILFCQSLFFLIVLFVFLYSEAKHEGRLRNNL
jgi:hypothetical protein